MYDIAMTYPKYTPPPVEGILLAVGAGSFQQLPKEYLCSEADARIIEDWLNRALTPAGRSFGSISNAAITPSTGLRFNGLDPNSPFQPWYVTGAEGFPPGWVGPAVAQMYVDGIGAPGEWVGVAEGNPHWVSKVVKDIPAPAPPPVSNPADAKTFADLQGANDDLPYIRRRIDQIAAALKIKD